MSLNTGQNLLKIYQSVVDDVISSVRESFLDEGVDEHVLNELKQLWLERLRQSRALDSSPALHLQQQQQPVAMTQMRQAVPAATPVKTQAAAPALQQVVIPQGLELSAGASAAAVALPANMYQQQVPQGYALVHGPGGQLVVQPTAAPLPAAPPPPLASGGAQQQQTFILQAPNAAAAFVPAMTMSGQPVQIQTTQGVFHVAAPAVSSAQQQVTQLDGTCDSPLATADDSSSLETDQEKTKIQNCSKDARTVSPTDGADAEETTSEVTSVCGPESDVLRQNDQKLVSLLLQLDGAEDTSSEDESDDDAGPDEEDEEAGQQEEEEPLNSDDDISDDDTQTIFDTDNVIVCQFDKISRNKGKWKFQLKDGIMNLGGKDFVFQKATGEADW